MTESAMTRFCNERLAHSLSHGGLLPPSTTRNSDRFWASDARCASCLENASQVVEYERVNDVASEIEREQRQARHEATGISARNDEPGQLSTVDEARPRMGTSSRRYYHGEPSHRRSGPSIGPNS